MTTTVAGLKDSYLQHLVLAGRSERTLEGRLRGDVDSGERQRPIETDPPEGAVRLLAQLAACPLVQRDGEWRGAVRAKAHESEAAPDVPSEHG